MSPRMENLARRYTDFLIKRYWLVLTVAAVLTVLSALSASRFQLKTDFVELLPQDEPSIKYLDEAKKRVGGLSNMIVAVSGEDVQTNRKLVDDLVARYNSISKDYVVYLKYHINDEKDYYTKNKQLYADLEDIKEIYKRLRAKLRYERIKNNPVLNMKFDDEELKPVDFDVSDIRDKYESKTSGYKRYVDGYFTGEEGKLFAILIYPPGASTVVDFGVRMLNEVKVATAEVCNGGPLPAGSTNLDKIINAGCPQRYPGVSEVGFTGSVVTAIDEQKAIVSDLVLVTTICLLLNLLVVLIFYRVWRSLVIVGAPVLFGTVWTFGISIYIVGSLNTSTAFLASIIVGNGINYGIIQFARYLEERKAGCNLEESLKRAVFSTAKATSIASLAASIAYGSLIITKFRGFNGFGYMGGLGMVLCWISSFSVMPALVVLTEKIWPLRFGKRHKQVPEGLFMRPFTKFVFRFKTPLGVLGWSFAFICILASVSYLKDPFEYNFRNLRNQTARKTGSGLLSNRVGDIFPNRLDPLFILADRPDQVPLIMTELNRKNTYGKYRKLFQDITSIYSFLPRDQEEKVKVLKKIRKQLSESTLSWLTDEQRKDVEEFRPPEGIRPLTKEDLPFAISRLFTELDGRMGLPIALYPTQDRSVWDGKFLMELSDASRKVSLPDGETVNSAGVATVFSDMIAAIERDGPRAVFVSLFGIIIMVIFAYRQVKFVLLAFVALFFSITWMVGSAALAGYKLNFLNFIALPISFGIGIDYTVNILSRYKLDGPGSVRSAMINTGGAVILCALTTIIGYSSLLIADNQALVSFGILANIGEFACLFAALVMIPLLIEHMERRNQRILSQQTRRINPPESSLLRPSEK
jgi:uncharacterized protein